LEPTLIVPVVGVYAEIRARMDKVLVKVIGLKDMAFIWQLSSPQTGYFPRKHESGSLRWKKIVFLLRKDSWTKTGCFQKVSLVKMISISGGNLTSDILFTSQFLL
jgi:hypothetical protein